MSRAPRPVFLSFDYAVDLPRASMIRDMVRSSGDYVFFDINWTVLTHLPEETVKAMIDEQLARCDCLLLLITEKTSQCPMVNYEIQRAYEMKKGSWVSMPTISVRILPFPLRKAPIRSFISARLRKNVCVPI